MIVKAKVLKAINEIENKLGNNFVNNFIGIYNDLGKYYLDFIHMDMKGKTHEQIANSLGIKRVTATQWINDTYIPRSIGAILEIYNRRFYKIPKHILARIIGWGMGDGGLDKRPHYFFFCSNKGDLKKAKVFIERCTSLKCKIKRNKTVGNITRHDGTIRNFSGDNWILRVSNTVFVRFLCTLGLPKGSKTIQEFLIPGWINSGDKTIKREFISALFECELERFRLEKRKAKILINSPIFGMCKSENHLQNLKDFLNQMRTILKEDFEIETSDLSMPIKANLRKDGNLTYLIRFAVSSSAENILKLSENMNFRFNTDKRDTLKIVVVEAKKKIKRKLEQLEKYNKSQHLFRLGYNFSQIAKEVGITHPTAREWVLTKNHLPREITNKTNLKKLIKLS